MEKKKNNKAPPNQTNPNPVSERVLEPRCVRACVWPTSLRACVLRACKALKHLVGDFSLVVLKTTSWFAFAFGANDKFVLSRTPRVLALSPSRPLALAFSAARRGLVPTTYQYLVVLEVGQPRRQALPPYHVVEEPPLPFLPPKLNFGRWRRPLGTPASVITNAQRSTTKLAHTNMNTLVGTTTTRHSSLDGHYRRG